MSRPGLLLAPALALLVLGAGGAPSTAGTPGRLPEDAEQEHGYYLRQLFGAYGENGTLPSEGLARLLGSLGLGRVQVVQIQHEELGHGHVSHLDLLEVQQDKHRHRHPLWEHGGEAAPSTGGPLRYRWDPSDTGGTLQVPVGPLRYRWDPSDTGGTLQVPVGPLSPPPSQPPSWPQAVPTEPPGAAGVPREYRPSLSLLGRVLGLEHSSADHPHDDCLNVTQLLGNFGLDSVAQLTPEQFTLLCPALLYQIDSRVCIRHRDEVTLPPPGGALWPALGWALLAVLSVSLPSVLAVLLLPLRARGSFRSVLAFLVALAVGTLCGDALLHLWPHAQGRHPEAPGDPSPAVLQGLAVLGGIYALFVLELLLAMLRRRREATGRPHGETPDLAPSRAGTELRPLAAPEAELEPRPPGPPHGHSHGPALPPGPGAADIVWMVVLGDGVHNLSDGLAIGAAFSHSLSSGLSTALAVLCHELPHELGDLAVLLRAGTAPRSLLLLNLLSALLSCLGVVAGVALGHSGTPLAPWLLTATAGIFLYVALADMLPEALRGSGEGTWSRFVLQNAGFLLGAGIMLGIALAEGHLRSWLQP
ncbi:zinc transporter ZIP10-like [Molothrus ater]|uniref:zinc transporter ZIP10-like n=1 Tax=Molothrus ater TaxID=84834 RepID=UPI001748B5BB|nr:zinc transporter ZIP10-like [Molothrus ater]